MKKLSKAQQEVMDFLKKQIDHARMCDSYYDYCMRYAELVTGVSREEYFSGEYKSKTNSDKLIIEYRFEDAIKEAKEEQYRKYYEQECSGIASCSANSRTIKKLQDMGLIEIIIDGGKQPDILKVLNY